MEQKSSFKVKLKLWTKFKNGGSNCYPLHIEALSWRSLFHLELHIAMAVATNRPGKQTSLIDRWHVDVDFLPCEAAVGLQLQRLQNGK
jgi:hypothetical protein